MFPFIFGSKPAENSTTQAHAEVVRANSYTPQGSGRSFHSFEECDASIKVWLPERIELALTELALVQERSDNEIARALLFIHLYGLSDFEAMRVQQKGWFKPRPLKKAVMAAVSIVKFSRPSTNPHPELGKNIYAFRVWLPKAMREDLQKLAASQGTLLSPYVREFLICQLLGKTYPSNTDDMAVPQGSAEAEKE